MRLLELTLIEAPSAWDDQEEKGDKLIIREMRDTNREIEHLARSDRAANNLEALQKFAHLAKYAGDMHVHESTRVERRQAVRHLEEEVYKTCKRLKLTDDQTEEVEDALFKLIKAVVDSHETALGVACEALMVVGQLPQQSTEYYLLSSKFCEKMKI